jgi:hypothetical protein
MIIKKLESPVFVTIDYPLADCPECKMVVQVNAISPYGMVITPDQMMAYILPAVGNAIGQSSIWRFKLS